MSDGPESVKRVNEFYESRYGKEPLKPEGELREKIATLQSQLEAAEDENERLNRLLLRIENIIPAGTELEAEYEAALEGKDE